MIAGECERAQRLLIAATVLDAEAPLRRVPLKIGDLLTRVQEALRRELLLTGPEATIDIAGDVQAALNGDGDLLVAAMTGAMSAVGVATGRHPWHLTLTAIAPAGRGTLVIELTDRSVALPESYIRSAFTAPWPIVDGELVLLMLRAAQRIASAHGGSMTIASHAGTTIRFQLPAERS